MPFIPVISTENATLCGSIMPIKAPIFLRKSLIFYRVVNATFIARRQRRAASMKYPTPA